MGDTSLAVRKKQNWQIRQENLYDSLQGAKYIAEIHKLLELQPWPKDRIREYQCKLDNYHKLLNKLVPNAVDRQDAITLTKEIVTDESGKQSESVRISQTVRLLEDFAGGGTPVSAEADGEDRPVLPAALPAAQT